MGVAGPTLAQTFRLHVEELLAEHLIAGDYAPEAEPRVDIERRRVTLRPVTDRESYRDALVQIGLVVTAPAHDQAALQFAEEVAIVEGETD